MIEVEQAKSSRHACWTVLSYKLIEWHPKALSNGPNEIGPVLLRRVSSSVLAILLVQI